MNIDQNTKARIQQLLRDEMAKPRSERNNSQIKPILRALKSFKIRQQQQKQPQIKLKPGPGCNSKKKRLMELLKRRMKTDQARMILNRFNRSPAKPDLPSLPLDQAHVHSSPPMHGPNSRVKDPYAHLGASTRRFLLPKLAARGLLVPQPRMGPYGVPFKGTSDDSDLVASSLNHSTASQFETINRSTMKDWRKEGAIDVTSFKQSFPINISRMTKYYEKCGSDPWVLDMRAEIVRGPAPLLGVHRGLQLEKEV